VILTAFFEGKCLFLEDRFPKFFGKLVHPLFKAFCSYLIYSKLFHKYGFDKDVYELPEMLFGKTGHSAIASSTCLLSIPNAGTYRSFQTNLEITRKEALGGVIGEKETQLAESSGVLQTQTNSLQNDQRFLSFVSGSKNGCNLSTVYAKKQLVFDKFFCSILPPPLPRDPAARGLWQPDLSDPDKQKRFVSTILPTSLADHTAKLNHSLSSILQDFLQLKRTFLFLSSFYCFRYVDPKVSDKLDYLFQEVP
jgi:hypothetical protein